MDAQQTRELQKLWSIAGASATRAITMQALIPDQTLAGYRLLRELGRGGMSAVWLAERADGIPKRHIALKLPLFAFTSALEIERFNRERDLLAALEHPNIARLYEAGVTESGQPFMALEFVDGMPIIAYADRHHLSVQDRLRLFEQMLGAVEHAHQRLIVHRDLKPSNVLVNTLGQVKLLDFGIAKLITSADAASAASELTRLSGLALTPRYAAPEQLAGEPISTATDVYLLGLLFYELLTGALPHVADPQSQPSVVRMLELVLSEAAIPPSRAPVTAEAAMARGCVSTGRLRSMLSGDLDTIVLKALRRQPRDRYASVGHYADDIRRFVAHQPIAARAPSVFYSAGLFLRRNRVVAVAAGIGLLTAIGIGAVAVRQYQEAQANAARATAVRNFIFDLVNDAEPNETHPGPDVTGVQMVHTAVHRARQQFEHQPRLQGELLGELGRMYTRLGKPATAGQVLAEALQLLEQHAPGNDPALNKTRAHLAGLLLRDGEVERAHALATAAKLSCTQSNAECPKARAYGSAVLSEIAMQGGQIEQALAAMRDSVADTALGFGPAHTEAAMAHVSLAVIARNAGRLSVADRAAAQAIEISARQILSVTDRVTLLRTKAMLDMDLGRYGSAREQLEELVERTSDVAERAVQSRLLATTLLLQGEAASALEAAEAAIRDATVADDAAEILFARHARARALALLGHAEQGLGEIDAVIQGFVGAGRPIDAPAVVRARRARAELLARSGRLEEAATELQALTRLPTEQADALELLGCVLSALKKPSEALTMHRHARALYRQNLPADHPFLLRNTLYQQDALAVIEPGPASRSALVETMTRAKRQFSPTSAWRNAIESCEKGLSCSLIL